MAGAGAALAYFLDPVSGKERRAKLREYWEERTQGTAEVVETGEDVTPTIVVNKQPAAKRPVT
ncbi:MAG TPA: YtxH domain-containing protein [Candidatus Dormibacteraeota bacterium]|nr:YtxH domain-containing protein [Candidatus Dormibacteraeota bacterium]